MPHHLARLACGLVLGVVIAFGAITLTGAPRTSEAAPDDPVSIIYINVTGEGATAKAWYDGVPSPGVPIQSALDKFAKEGYRVARITDNLRSAADDVAFTILLERVRTR